MKKSILLLLPIFILLSYFFGYAEIKKEYYKNGALKSECNYEKGIKHGIAKWYYGSGVLMMEGNFKNGKRDGIFKTYYYKDGRIEYTLFYKDDILISGKCGSNGRQWSNRELSDFDKGINYPECP